MKKVQVIVFFGMLMMIACETAIREGKTGFLTGATSMISTLAKDLVTRSASNSQVLSLNLTNLFILMVLKAIIFGAGAFGYGHTGYGRSAESLLKENITKNFNADELLSESELIMMLGYLKGDSTHDYGCLQRIACEDPLRAQEYALTGRIFLKGYEILSESLNATKYINALSHMEEAINYGRAGQNCLEKYICQVS